MPTSPGSTGGRVSRKSISGGKAAAAAATATAAAGRIHCDHIRGLAKHGSPLAAGNLVAQSHTAVAAD